MPSPLPSSRSWQSLRPPVWVVSLLGACVLLAAGDAAALDLELHPPRERGGYLYANVEVADPFEARVRESLARGMPATLVVHAELWRRRNGWFDRLEGSYEAQVRIRYEVWSEQYRLERAGAEAERVSTLDSLSGLISRPWALPVARVGQLKPAVRYYVVVSAVLKPLSVEDVQEVEGWLSGEVKEKRHSGLGVLTGIPRSLFEAARNVAGFGDERSRLISTDFTPENLPPAGH